MRAASVTDRQAALAEIAAELQSVLSTIHDAYGRVLQVIARQRHAVAHADAAALKAAMDEMAAIEASIREADEQRRALMGRACPERGSTMSVAALTDHLPQSAAAALRSQASTLRARLDEVQRHQAVLRASVSSVLGHMDGLWRQIGQSLDRTGTYQPAGAGRTRGPGPISLDLTR